MKSKDWCCNHNAACPTFPHQDGGALKVHIAGFTCVDWSILGDKDGWLGKSAPVFLAWLADNTVHDPKDLICGECTQGFDDMMLGELADASGYQVTTFNISPDMFGFPATRGRKYMILLRKQVLRWSTDMADPLVIFPKLFGRQLSILGDVFWSAPPQYVSRFHREWARSKHLPEYQANTEEWPSKLLMSKTMRDRVRAWEQNLGFSWGCIGFFSCCSCMSMRDTLEGLKNAHSRDASNKT